MQKSIMDYVTESFNRSELIKEIIYFDQMRKMTNRNEFRDAFETNLKQYLREYGTREIVTLVVRMFDARKMCSNENLEVPIWDTRFSSYQYVKFKFRGFDHVCAILPYFYFTIHFNFDPQNKYVQDAQLGHKECYKYGEACNNCLDLISKASFRHSEILKSIEDSDYMPKSEFVPDKENINVPVYMQDREISPKIEKDFAKLELKEQHPMKQFKDLMRYLSESNLGSIKKIEGEFHCKIEFKEERGVKIPYSIHEVNFNRLTNLSYINSSGGYNEVQIATVYYYCGKFRYEKP